MIVPMTTEYAKQISGWTYGNEYALYSFESGNDTIAELMNSEYYAACDAAGELYGYFCFGASARIATVEAEAYAPDMCDFGLGMKPELCGKGLGYSFVRSGMDFAVNTLKADQIRLTVAAFNTRAIRVYERIGFKPASSVTHRISGKPFMIMTYET